MRNILVSFFLGLLITGSISAQSGKISREEYIEMYKDLAVEEMIRCGIPASITLAQGMLESDNGNSTLARKGNNHFGIKCHSGWRGGKMFHDDDARRECFRKYKKAEESYIDHSEFLMGSSRYSSLFELDRTDYRAWAKGLKKAGYATSPKYADMLIKIIEENELHRYDLADGKTLQRKHSRNSLKKEPEGKRAILKNNRIDYIILKEGDTFESLTEELGLLRYEIFRYNDLPENAAEIPGQAYYIQPKRKKAARGNDFHRFQEGESLWQVSQRYGIKLERLYDLNLLEPDSEPTPGDRLNLRKRKKVSSSELANPPQEEDSDRIRFEFDEGR